MVFYNNFHDSSDESKELDTSPDVSLVGVKFVMLTKRILCSNPNNVPIHKTRLSSEKTYVLKSGGKVVFCDYSESQTCVCQHELTTKALFE